MACQPWECNALVFSLVCFAITILLFGIEIVKRKFRRFDNDDMDKYIRQFGIDVSNIRRDSLMLRSNETKDIPENVLVEGHDRIMIYKLQKMILSINSATNTMVNIFAKAKGLGIKLDLIDYNENAPIDSHLLQSCVEKLITEISQIKLYENLSYKNLKIYWIMRFITILGRIIKEMEQFVLQFGYFVLTCLSKKVMEGCRLFRMNLCVFRMVIEEDIVDIYNAIEIDDDTSAIFHKTMNSIGANFDSIKLALEKLNEISNPNKSEKRSERLFELFYTYLSPDLVEFENGVFKIDNNQPQEV